MTGRILQFLCNRREDGPCLGLDLDAVGDDMMMAPPGSLAIMEQLPVVLSFRDGSGRRSLRYQPASKSSGP
jgi:hypothetical protein